MARATLHTTFSRKGSGIEQFLHRCRLIIFFGDDDNTDSDLLDRNCLLVDGGVNSGYATVAHLVGVLGDQTMNGIFFKQWDCVWAGVKRDDLDLALQTFGLHCLCHTETARATSGINA